MATAPSHCPGLGALASELETLGGAMAPRLTPLLTIQRTVLVHAPVEFAPLTLVLAALPPDL